MNDNAKIVSKNYLQKMCVNIITEVFVLDYDGTSLTLSNGIIIKTKTVIWAAGVIGNTIKGLPSNVVAKGNRLVVDEFSKIDNTKNIFAIGDIAFMQTIKHPIGHPQLANVAIQQARNLATNFKRGSQQKRLQKFEYRDLGSMATIGKNKAVVDLAFIKFSGFFAWLIWMFLHLMLILSVKNKLIIFINWAWAYITKDTSLRLILKADKNK